MFYIENRDITKLKEEEKRKKKKKEISNSRFELFHCHTNFSLSILPIS